VNAAQQCYAYYHLLSLNGRGDSSKIDLHGQPVKHGVKYALKYLQVREKEKVINYLKGKYNNNERVVVVCRTGRTGSMSICRLDVNLTSRLLQDGENIPGIISQD